MNLGTQSKGPVAGSGEIMRGFIQKQIFQLKFK